MTTWSQLGIHRTPKPILCLSVGGFFAPLKEQCERAVKAGFIAVSPLFARIRFLRLGKLTSLLLHLPRNLQEKNLSFIKFIDAPDVRSFPSVPVPVPLLLYADLASLF